MNYVNCPKCGAETPEINANCTECFTQLREDPYCYEPNIYLYGAFPKAEASIPEPPIQRNRFI